MDNITSGCWYSGQSILRSSSAIRTGLLWKTAPSMYDRWDGPWWNCLKYWGAAQVARALAQRYVCQKKQSSEYIERDKMGVDLRFPDFQFLGRSLGPLKAIADPSCKVNDVSFTFSERGKVMV